MNINMLISATLVLALSIYSFPLLNNYWLSVWKSKPSVADLIVTNGVIFTADDKTPFSDSMAVRNGRILRVGNYSSIQEVAGEGTQELNLEGKVVVPGFIDSHVHFISGGLQMGRVQMRGVNLKDEFVKRIKEAVENSKKGSWILGGGWNNDLWGGELPMASWIDDITPYNPVWIVRMDGHMGLANSVALQLAGITKLTPDPDGGSIMKTADGEPTGLLIDVAMKLLLQWIPEVSVDDRRESLRRASDYALMRGVTTVVDVGRYFPGVSVQLPWEDFSDVYQWAVTSANLRVRELIKKAGHALSNWVYLGGVKAFADGSLGSNSALFYEPYADEPHNYGLQVTELENLFNLTMAADRSGIQVAIHAIGDRANDLVLGMYESVIKTNGKRERRFRIEHAQHLASGTAARFGDLGIAASVQPQHLLDDADSAIKKLGSDRAQKGSYLFQSLLDSNALVALGSDWPVADMNPLDAIRTAMKRVPRGWNDAWNPSERMSLADALTAHTISAACACFLEKDVGSLSSGKLADFVVLSSNSWEDFAADGYASVTATYVSGLQAYP